jgi:hypothetical protein
MAAAQVGRPGSTPLDLTCYPWVTRYADTAGDASECAADVVLFTLQPGSRSHLTPAIADRRASGSDVRAAIQTSK